MYPSLIAPTRRTGRVISTPDRKSTRLNSSHTEIYTLSLHDALPILSAMLCAQTTASSDDSANVSIIDRAHAQDWTSDIDARSEEHTSELQSHRDLHSFPTRRSSDLECDALRTNDRFFRRLRQCIHH